MRHETLVELAAGHGVHLPEALVSEWPPRLSAADERGWFRFQRLYDIARSVVRTGSDVRRLLTEAALDERADGSGWLEIQVDPSGYAARLGGLTPALELVLEAAAEAAAATGVGIGVIVAANRTKHPLEARTLARLASGYAGRGVIGFGLSNDERRGTVADFAPAFRIARRAGLAAVPHGGELCGPDSVRACLDELHADRIGHGVAAAADSGAAGPAGRRRHRAGGVPVLERGPRRGGQPGRRAAARAATRPGSRSRWAPTTRCCSARGSPRSTRSPGRSHGMTDPSSPTWPGCRSPARPRRSRPAAMLLAGIDAWLAAGPDLSPAPALGQLHPD